jgi:hypothetical protein
MNEGFNEGALKRQYHNSMYGGGGSLCYQYNPINVYVILL